MAGEAAKRLLPARGELMLGFMGQVKSVFNHQEYESSEEHISTRDAPTRDTPSVERVLEESLFDAEKTNPCCLSPFVRCQVGYVVGDLESS